MHVRWINGVFLMTPLTTKETPPELSTSLGLLWLLALYWGPPAPFQNAFHMESVE